MKAGDYQDIGQYLREVRENMRIPVEDAAHYLHIRPKYLRAIESGDLKDLPGKAYTLGYIKTYSEFLRLDPEEVCDAYEAILTPQGERFFVPVQSFGQNLPSKRVLQWSLAGFVILYGYWYFAMHDRTQVSPEAESVPDEMIQSLDKTLHDAMDSTWKTCLSDADPYCFVELRYKATVPFNGILYDDLELLHNSPRKP